MKLSKQILSIAKFDEANTNLVFFSAVSLYEGLGKCMINATSK